MFVLRSSVFSLEPSRKLVISSLSKVAFRRSFSRSGCTRLERGAILDRLERGAVLEERDYSARSVYELCEARVKTDYDQFSFGIWI